MRMYLHVAVLNGNESLKLCVKRSKYIIVWVRTCKICKQKITSNSAFWSWTCASRAWVCCDFRIMDKLLSIFNFSSSDKKAGADCSFADRLSSTYTAMLLAGFAIGVQTHQWFTDKPMSCWCPAHFESSHCDFTDNVRQPLPKIRVFIQFWDIS